MNKVAQVLEEILQLLAMKYGKCFVFPEHCCNHQSGLKPYNFTTLATGVETEQLCCNLFAQRGAIMCELEFDRTEDRTNLNLKR